MTSSLFIFFKYRYKIFLIFISSVRASIGEVKSWKTAHTTWSITSEVVFVIIISFIKNRGVEFCIEVWGTPESAGTFRLPLLYALHIIQKLKKKQKKKGKTLFFGTIVSVQWIFVLLYKQSKLALLLQRTLERHPLVKRGGRLLHQSSL